jgi:hypothetical protein
VPLLLPAPLRAPKCPAKAEAEAEEEEEEEEEEEAEAEEEEEEEESESERTEEAEWCTPAALPEAEAEAHCSSRLRQAAAAGLLRLSSRHCCSRGAVASSTASRGRESSLTEKAAAACAACASACASACACSRAALLICSRQPARGRVL